MKTNLILPTFIISLLLLTGLVSASAPITIFSMNPNPAFLSSNVTFNDLSADGPTTWNWTFGDGYYSDNQTAFHIFPTTGQYTIILNTSNGDGWSNNSANLTIMADPPVTNFTADTNVGAAPLVVTFSDTTTGGNISNWYWDFGDSGSSVDQNPIHTFTSIGTFNVVLTASNPSGSDISATYPIYVVSNPIPIILFTAAPVSGSSPLSVQFTDMSVAVTPLSNWNWTFGDGNFSNVQNPTYIYSSNGQYTVSLIGVSDGYSNDTTKVGYINVGLTPNAISGDFSANATSSTSYPMAVAFTDESVCNPVCTQWAWDFNNDGSIESTQQNPTYIYSYPGNYSVKLIVSNGMNTGTKIKYQYINVGPVLVAVLPVATGTWNPGYVGNTSFAFKADTYVDLANSTYLKYWLQNFSATGNFSTYGFATGLMAPLMHTFGFWIYVIVWALYMFAVWIRSQDVTLPLIIGILSIGTFGALFPKESLPVIIVMFVICGAIIITKLMKDSI